MGRRLCIRKQERRELWRLLVTQCFYVFRDKEVAQVTHQHSGRVCLPSIQTLTGPPSLWAAFANRFPLLATVLSQVRVVRGPAQAKML